MDAVYDELRRQILSGRLGPTTQLRQEQLAAQLGVSTTPLREALRRLESEGLVRTLAHRRVVVADLDRAELVPLYELKEHIETFAAALAAEHATEEELREIEALVEQTFGPFDSEDDAWRANRSLHEAIYRASHNPLLIDFMNTVWDRYERFRRLLGFLVFAPPMNPEHVELAQAIRDRDPVQAREIMRTHLRHGRDYIENSSTNGTGVEQAGA